MQIEYRAGQNLIGITGNKKALSVPGNSESAITKVSAVIITYNEEPIISETLSRLWWCDEIVIIDSGSTDRTIEICEQYGCSVFTRIFQGFGEQKKYGVAKARNNW